MTSEERIATIERIVKDQFIQILIQMGEIERGQVVATKDKLLNDLCQYVRRAIIVTGDNSLQMIDMFLTQDEYWSYVKRLADKKAFVITDDEVRIAECYDRSKHYIG